MMQFVRLKLVVPIAFLALGVSGTSRANEEVVRLPVHTGGLQGKIEYCTDCHGPSGRGYRGYYPIPRLAGQQPEYVENQLRAFVEKRRVKPSLSLARIHGVRSSMRGALAHHFARLNPKPIGGVPMQLVAQGRKLYQDGDPEANVPACAACHGPQGEGAGANPRLAGQLYPYTVGRLSDLAKEHSREASETAGIMMPIARSLSRSQRDAIAAYVGNLK